MKTESAAWSSSFAERTLIFGLCSGGVMFSVRQELNFKVMSDERGAQKAQDKDSLPVACPY